MPTKTNFKRYFVPLGHNPSSAALALYLGAAILFVLLTIQPFNMPEFEFTIQWVKVVLTSINCALSIYIFDKHVPKMFKAFYSPESWHPYKSIVHLLAMMVFINTINYMIVHRIGHHAGIPPSYWEMMTLAFSLLIFVGPLILAWNYVNLRDNIEDYQVQFEQLTLISSDISKVKPQNTQVNYSEISSSKRALWMAVSVCVIVNFILYVFEPYDLGLLQHDYRVALLFGIGIVAGIVVYISEHVVPQLFKSIYRRHSWSGWLNIIQISTALAMAGLFIGIYLNVVFEGDPYVPTLSESIRYTIAMGIIPGLAILAIDYILYLRGALNYERNNLVEHLSAKSEPVTNVSEDDKSFYGIYKNDIILCSAMGNYMRIYYRNADNTVATKIIRCTLTEVYTNLQQSHFIKCHRSHMVNMNFVIQYSGNSKGMNLKLQGLDTVVTVSRAYTSVVKSWIKSIDQVSDQPEKVAEIPTIA